MSRDIFHQKLDQGTQLIDDMGSIIDYLLKEIITTLQNRVSDKEQVNILINEEKKLDQLEVDVEMLCIELLALQQPMAIDLRTIISMLKISSDLERIGDHLRKIIRKFRKVVKLHDFEHFSSLAEMTILLRQMVAQIVIAFKENNLDLVERTLSMDAEIDKLQRGLFRQYIQKIESKPVHEVISSEIYLLFITRFLERIGDHVENIGERVVFMVTGKLNV
jgi:phosphate transport system protein